MNSESEIIHYSLFIIHIMQYGVPQFIDMEDKIVGPLTGKQTLYLMIGFGFLILISSFFEFGFFMVSCLIIVPTTLAFAFWKPKGMTVAKWIANTAGYYTSDHLYVWRREPGGIKIKTSQKKVSRAAPQKNISKSRIGELAWLLDTSSSISLPYEVKERPGKK